MTRDDAEGADGLAPVVAHLTAARLGLIEHGRRLEPGGERLRVLAAYRALIELCQLYGLLTPSETD